MDREQLLGLLDIAIEREKEAYNFYSEVAKTFKDRGLVTIFTELADEEKGHRNLLESFKQNPEKHFQMEAPEKDYHLAEQTELPPLSTSMKPADAFALAMKKEQQAAEFYQDLAKRTSSDDVKELCLNLASMELKHKQKIENAYVDVAYVESF
jgi:rubrerythrin